MKSSQRVLKRCLNETRGELFFDRVIDCNSHSRRLTFHAGSSPSNDGSPLSQYCCEGYSFDEGWSYERSNESLFEESLLDGTLK